MIFQSLASQHNFKTAWRQLWVRGTKEDNEELKTFLLNKYDGKNVELYSKGRTALAEGVRIATKGEGRVLITGLTCYSVEQAVIAAGCRPVYIDISYRDLQYSKKALEQAFEDFDDVKAIIVQNTLGIPANITLIERLANEKNIPIIEDLAHSVGSKYLTGIEMGMVGDIVMLSFGRDKAVDATNGGAIILKKDFEYKLNKPTISASFIDQLRDRAYPLFAKIVRFFYPVFLGKIFSVVIYKVKLATKSADGEVDTRIKLPNWQAKLALRNLKLIPEVVKSRQRITSKIYEEIQLEPITNAKDERISLLRVPFVVENRHEILKALKSEGIFLEDIWYDAPVSPRRYMKDSSFVRSDSPTAVKISNEIINIPTHENISDNDIVSIALIINRVAKNAKR